jgi:hypothetical protein
LTPIENIKSMRFQSPLDLDQMLGVLATRTGDFARWQVRESEYEDRYLHGTTVAGNKIRVIHYGDHYEAEIYFDFLTNPHRVSSDAERREFLDSFHRRVLGTIEAGNIVET